LSDLAQDLLSVGAKLCWSGFK